MQDVKKHAEVIQFMQDLADQVQYKPIVPELCEEIYQHIEDRQDEYMDEGMDLQKATTMALQDLGDPSDIGVRLNQTHYVKTPSKLLFSIIALMIAGNIYQIIYQLQNRWYAEDPFIAQLFYLLRENLYMLMGIPLLILIIYRGYPCLVKNSHSFLNGFILFSIIMSLLDLARDQMVWLLDLLDYAIPYLVINIWSASMLNIPLLMFSVPIIMIFAYKIRRKWRYSYIISITAYAVIAFFGAFYSEWSFGFVYKVMFLLASFMMLLFMAWKRFFSENWKQDMIIIALLCLAVSSLWGYHKREYLHWQFNQCFYPETMANNYFADAYNSILIKDLLGRAKIIGEVELSEQELTSYYDTSWYFDGSINIDFDEWNRDYPDELYLKDVLPQHYHNNYLISSAILTSGWLVGAMLVVIMIGICFSLIYIALQIRNPIGQLTALSAALCLSLQIILYIMGNFGYQFGWFGVLPYLSEGKVSHLTNVILTGMLLSAYRYDNVIKEPRQDDAVFRRQSRLV